MPGSQAAREQNEKNPNGTLPLTDAGLKASHTDRGPISEHPKVPNRAASSDGASADLERFNGKLPTCSSQGMRSTRAGLLNETTG